MTLGASRPQVPMPHIDSLIVAHAAAGIVLLAVLHHPPSSPRARRWAFALLAVLAARYAFWRMTGSLEGAWSLSGCVSSASEMLLLLAALLNARALTRTVSRSEEADRHSAWWAERGQAAPRVEILIPTYDEPCEIIERSIASAQAQDYENSGIWVLDDGGRAAVRSLAERWDVAYLAREHDGRAKAGNLNSALAHLRGSGASPPFVAVIDCDYVAAPRFVSRVLSLMHDEGVALVQTPQHFYNRDHFQACLPHVEIPNHLRFTWDHRYPSKDAAGRGECIGTSFIARTAALRSIGDFAHECVTEDVLTSARLRAAGWRIVYLAEPLSCGLAPEGLREYLVQKTRWALGFVQMARMAWQGRNASAWRRALAVEANLRPVYTPLCLWLLLTVAPVGYWFFGLQPLSANLWDALEYGLPLLLCLRVTHAWINRGFTVPLYNEAVALVGCCCSIRAILAGLLGVGSTRFVVTPKGRARTTTLIHWEPLLWTAPAALALALAVVWGASQTETWRSDGVAVLLLAWAAYAFSRMGLAAFFCFERARRRRDERRPGDHEVAILRFGELRERAAIENVSSEGVCVRASLPLAPGQPGHIELDGVGSVACSVIHRQADGRVGLRLDPTWANRRALILRRFSPCHVRWISSAPPGVVWLGMLRSALGGRRRSAALDKPRRSP
jgi:cellulose synthase (UDP-forming)